MPAGDDATFDIPEHPSRQAARLERFLSRAVRPVGERWSPRGQQLRTLRRLSDSAGLRRLPTGTRAWPARYDHDGGPGLRGVWIQADNASPANGVLLYLHGGGFVFGSPRSHRGVAHALSRRVRVPVFLLDYRRAPEHSFPVAADEAIAAYRMLLARGVAAHRIVVAGDSAGGHLTAGLLADLVRERLPLPVATALFSPFLDLTCVESFRRDAERRDPFVPPTYALKCAHAYAGRLALDDPRLDVLGAAKTGWPPMLIQTGGTECLLGDSEAMATSMAAAGSDCELQVWPGQVHGFSVFTGLLPEARDALRYAGAFLRRRLAG
jgi:acetyl esterase/lipase